ncbi:MAG: substrate-binding domain-containing protein [Actinomycetota bacterium]
MKINFRKKSLVVAASLALTVTATPAHAVDLVGSGATFVQNLVEACKPGFAKATGHSYTYGGGGSSTGQRNSDASVGDFWFSDSAYRAGTRASIVHAPVVAAPIAVIHNLATSRQLYLSPATIAGIFGGTITRWNDPAIVADNNRSVTQVVYKKDSAGNAKLGKDGKPEILRTTKRTISMSLPNRPITVIYRSDGSGTSNLFTTYLNGVAPSIWNKAGNNAFTTAFPGNINAPENIGRITGASGSQGVATLAARTKDSITYAEKSFADANKLKIAAIGNASGNFVLPTNEAVSAFLGDATVDAAKGFFTFNYQTKEPGAYPLGIVSYALVDTNYADKTKAAAVKQLMNYLMTEECVGGANASLGFVFLSGKLREVATRQVNKIG